MNAKPRPFTHSLIYLFPAGGLVTRQPAVWYILMSWVADTLGRLSSFPWLRGRAGQAQVRSRHGQTNPQPAQPPQPDPDQHYRTLFHETSEAILIYDLHGKVQEVNQTAARQIGYTTEEMQGMHITDFDRSGNVSPDSGLMLYLKETGQVFFESLLTRRDGSSFPVEVNARLIELRGRPAVLNVARDITLRKTIEQSEREQRAMIEALRDIAANLSSTLHLEEVLDRILNHLGRVVEYDAAAILLIDGESARLMRQRGYVERGIQPPADPRYPLADMPNLRWIVKHKKALVIPDTSQDPDWTHTPLSGWASSYAGAPIIVHGQVMGILSVEHAQPGFFQPVTGDRMQAFADHAAIAINNARLYGELQFLAGADALTGLYNRRGLSELGQREVDRAIRFNRPLAVLMLDIDHFKQFNDKYSYTVGDEVLSILARRIKKATRRDDLACRYGGDEFLVLLAENTLETALVVAEHIRQAVHEEPFETSQGECWVTISIGAAAQSPAELNLDQLIETAGAALHIAKQEGRNQVASSNTI